MVLRLLASLLPLLLAACGTPATGGDEGAPEDLASEPDLGVFDLSRPPDLTSDHQLVVARPYLSKAPAGYDPKTPTPLVLALHGLGDDGANFVKGFGLLALADTKGFLIAYPDGTPTGVGGNYWNAHDVCCQLTMPPPDDVAYLAAVVHDMAQRYNVDPLRVFVIGLSNGGMMAHRLGCDFSGEIAGIASVSGVQANDASACKPPNGMAVLEVHGTKDTTIPYDGGPSLNGLGPVVKSTHVTMDVWVDRNQCDPTPDPLPPIDIDGSLMGSETTIEKWGGCLSGGATELWTVVDGPHVPQLTPGAPGLIYDWLAAHPKP